MSRMILLLLLALPGMLDTTFGKDGKMITDLNNRSTDVAIAVAIDAEGRIIAAGRSAVVAYDYRNDDPALVRYNADGSIDTTFGDNGIVITPLDEESIDVILDVEIDSQGRIVAAGITYNESMPSQGFVARYTTDGSLDTTFSSDGIHITALEENSAFHRLLVLDDDKVLAVGSNYNDILLVRYTANGIPDRSFGENGVIIPYLSEFWFVAIAGAAFDSEGGLIIATTYRVVTLPVDDFYIVRFHADGTLDETFGLGGVTITDFASGRDSAYDMAIDTQGRIVVTGGSYTLEDPTDVVLARYLPDGTLDTSFGVEGKVINDFVVTQDDAVSVVVDQAGDIIVVTATSEDDIDGFSVIRYNEDGSLDGTFDRSGRLRLNFGTTGDLPGDAVLDAEGNLIVVGRAGEDDSNFGIVRVVMR